MRIFHNLEALNAWRTATATKLDLGKTLEKLSSGLRINRAGDDAAGLAISEKMRNQIKGLNKAIENAQHAISMIQTAEGALNEIHAILKRMRELAVQATTDTNTDVDREQLQAEFNRLREEIDRIAKTTQYNAKNLLDGKLEGPRAQNAAKLISRGSAWFEIAGYTLTGTSVQNAVIVLEVGQFSGTSTSQLDVRATLVTSGGSTVVLTTVGATSLRIGGVTITWDSNRIAKIDDYGGALGSGTRVDGGTIVTYGISTNVDNVVVFHIGANEGQIATIGFQNMNSDSLGIGNETLVKIDTQQDAEFAISLLDGAIYKVSAFRSELGAMQNRLEHTVKNLSVAMENLTAAESRIRDADMAREMMEFTRQQILMQSGTAMLAQANALPQNVLQLLR